MHIKIMVLCRRVVRPWLGLKMLDLNEMIIAQLKERSPAFPNVKRGILVPSVCIMIVALIIYTFNCLEDDFPVVLVR